jgi:hypothetical protein
MVRDEPGARGKGRALRWAMDRLLAASPPPDAIVVVDADTVADPEFLATLSVLFEAGARVVQGESLLAEDGTAPTALRVAAFMLFNRVRPAGREVLGRSGFLAGNGMLLARDVLAARPWAAYTSAEDLEYALGLHLAGVRIAFARGATLVSPAAPDAAAAAQQQLRWEGGKAHLARSWVPRLLRAAVAERRPALAVTALELALPPLGFLCGGALAGLVAAAVLAALGVAAWWAALPWLVAVAAIPVAVLIGLRAGGAGPSAYRAMAHAPLFVLAKALRLRRVLAFRGETWVRTRRARSTS